MRPAVGVAVILIASSLVGTGCARFRWFQRTETAPVADVGPRVGSPAPDLVGEDFDGVRFKLSDYRGKVVMLSFWASWCRPCMNLIPHERHIAERYRAKPFVLIGVNHDNDAERARNVMANCGIGWRNWQTVGDNHPIKSAWPVSGLPTTVLIDADGVIRSIRVGGVIDEHIIDGLIAQAAKK